MRLRTRVASPRKAFDGEWIKVEFYAKAEGSFPTDPIEFMQWLGVLITSGEMLVDGLTVRSPLKLGEPE